MKPLVLITNDDGIDSPGLLAVAEAIEPFSEVMICAPATQQTCMGRAFPRTKDLGIVETRTMKLNDTEVTAYAIHSSPAYSVAHGVLELSKRTPDLVISGVNYGENLGTILTCSGTVGAVLEAHTHGIPGIAFSIPADLSIQRSTAFPSIDWEPIKKIVTFWTLKLLKEKEIYETKWLNINIPSPTPEVNNFAYTKQSNQNLFYSIKPEPRDLSKPFELKTESKYDVDSLDQLDDIYAVYIKKCTSVTPIVHDLTSPAFLRR